MRTSRDGMQSDSHTLYGHGDKTVLIAVLVLRVESEVVCVQDK